MDDWHSWLIWRVASLHNNSDLPCSTDHMIEHAYVLPATLDPRVLRGVIKLTCNYMLVDYCHRYINM